jgi:F-type H+-transporting ATPase subunit c
VTEDHLLAEIHKEVVPDGESASRRKLVRRQIALFSTALVGLLLAAPVFAQSAGAAAGGDETAKWIVITSGFAMAIAAFGGAIGQSKVAAAACEGVARNPGARPGIQLFFILGLVFIETLALFTFAVIFAKVK